MHLAICQTCRFTFALPAQLDGATCPKPDCDGIALVSDGSFANAFQILHEAFPTAMPRSQKRELQKLLRKMAAGKVTAEEAIQDESLSPETRSLLATLAKFGYPVITLILMLLTLLQNQWQHSDSRRDQAKANEDHRQLLETLAANLEHLHQNDAVLAERLSRAGEARLVAIEQEQSAAPPPRQAENDSGPSSRSQKPRPTRKPKKGKKKRA